MNEKFIFKHIDEKEFHRRLSLITDQTTNVGFLRKGKLFHGIVTQRHFKLKKIRTLQDEDFRLNGEFVQRGDELIVTIKIVRGPLSTMFPFLLLIAGATFLFGTIKNDNFDLRYLPFMFIATLGILWLLLKKRDTEFNKIRAIFLNLYKAGE